MKMNIALAILITTTVFLAWSPWVTKEYAEKKVIGRFEKEWTGVIDGCGLNCEGCGIIDSRKIPFGYLITIQFKCGMKEYFQQDTNFVSFLGTIH